MVITKTVEIRDRATFIPALAIQVVGGTYDALLQRAGFGGEPMVILVHLEAMTCAYDPERWSRGNRTMFTAHRFLETHFDTIKNGEVIDVEYILGEKLNKKLSEVSR